MKSSHVKISKFFSLVLRHDPGKIGLTLDDNGWAEVDALLAKAPAKLNLTRALLLEVVETNDKQRFALSEDGTRIRASQGHSVAVDLRLTPMEPPETLYHGTVERFLDGIFREGLKPGARQYVHLSPDLETARKVGARRGTPVILTLPAREMFKGGHVFRFSENGVWLTDSVPPERITRLE